MTGRQNGDQPGETENKHQLWTVSAGGFSATADAFAISRTEAENEESNNIWFLSMLGPQTSVKAIAAALLGNPPKPAHLTPGAEGLALEEGHRMCWPHSSTLKTWTSRLARLSNGMGYHLMVYTRIAEYSYDQDDFILISRDEQQVAEKYHAFLDRRTSIPMHRSWANWLWERSLEKGDTTRLESLGICAWRCRTLHNSLEYDIGQAIRRGELTVEKENPPEGEPIAGATR